MSNKNKLIIDLAMNGTTPKDTAKMINKPLSIVYTVIKRFQMTGCVKRKPDSGFRRSVRTPQLIKAVKSRIFRNPVRSMKKMAKKLSVSQYNIRNVVSKDLKAKSRARVKKLLVSQSVKEKRSERSKKFLSLL